MRIEKTQLATGKETYKLLAEEGMVLMRKSDGQLFGEELTLGYVWYLAGIKLLDEEGNPQPHWEVPGDYTEVDKPEEPEDTEEPEYPEEPEEANDEVEETPYEPVVDLTELERFRKEKLKALDKYDKSSAVNEFFYNGEQMWFPLVKRQGARGAIESRETLGLNEMTYTLDNGVQLTLPLQTWRYLLAMVEVYAQDCYNVTASHAANIKRLETIEEVIGYDYTIGYPEKLTFNV